MSQEEALHLAICKAVALMNVQDWWPAKRILSEALVDYADAALAAKEPKSADSTPSAPPAVSEKSAP